MIFKGTKGNVTKMIDELKVSRGACSKDLKVYNYSPFSD